MYMCQALTNPTSTYKLGMNKIRQSFSTMIKNVGLECPHSFPESRLHFPSRFSSLGGDSVGNG